MGNPRIAGENSGLEDLLPDDLGKLLEAYQDFRAKEGRNPTWPELATALDICPDTVKRCAQDLDAMIGELTTRMAIACFWRLKRLLEVQFSGDLYFKSDQVYCQYIGLRRAFLELSDETPTLETLRRELLGSAIPESLYDVDHEFPDVDWEYAIEPALRAVTGKIMAFCVESSIDPFKDTEVDLALVGCDRFIEDYEEDKKSKEQDFWKRVEGLAENAPWAKASGSNAAKGQRQQPPEPNMVAPSIADQANPNSLEVTEGEGGLKEQVPAPGGPAIHQTRSGGARTTLRQPPKLYLANTAPGGFNTWLHKTTRPLPEGLEGKWARHLPIWSGEVPSTEASRTYSFISQDGEVHFDMALIDNRTQVIILCRGEGTGPFLAFVLGELGEAWPETRPVIDRYLQSLHQCPNKEPCETDGSEIRGRHKSLVGGTEVQQTAIAAAKVSMSPNDDRAHARKQLEQEMVACDGLWNASPEMQEQLAAMENAECDQRLVEAKQERKEAENAAGWLAEPHVLEQRIPASVQHVTKQLLRVASELGTSPIDLGDDVWLQPYPLGQAAGLEPPPGASAIFEVPWSIRRYDAEANATVDGGSVQAMPIVIYVVNDQTTDVKIHCWLPGAWSYAQQFCNKLVEINTPKGAPLRNVVGAASLVSERLAEPRKLPKGQGMFIQDYMVALPREYHAFVAEYSKRPTIPELAERLVVSDKTIQRRKKDYLKAGGTWPPPRPATKDA